MKVCILGDGLVSLTLAKVLVLKGISVDIFFNSKIKKYSFTRTIGIAKSNVNYLDKKVLSIRKILWNIKKIKVYTENFKKNEILNFSNSNDYTFSMVKNNEFYDILKKNLINNKFVKFKKNKDYKEIIKENYNLIINCDLNSQITRKFFSNKITKKYYSFAYTAIIDHKKIIKNNIATQVFTNNGPIAFLPISNTQTSIVYSLRNKLNNNKYDIKKLIHRFNPKYEIIKINSISKFKLNLSNLRNYYKNNILAFGDLLHKIHPLAGQGFNMSLRDIKCLSQLIDEKTDLGLDLDTTICHEFEKKMKDKNFIFSVGLDWIYEIFNIESKTKNEVLIKSINFLGKNKFLNSFFKKYADEGFIRE